MVNQVAYVEICVPTCRPPQSDTSNLHTPVNLAKVVLLLPDTDLQIVSDVKSGKIMPETLPAVVQGSSQGAQSGNNSFPLTQSAAAALGYLGRGAYATPGAVWLGSTGMSFVSGSWYGLSILLVSWGLKDAGWGALVASMYNVAL
jgi:hypothetical protein